MHNNNIYREKCKGLVSGVVAHLVETPIFNRWSISDPGLVRFIMVFGIKKSKKMKMYVNMCYTSLHL